ncbi:hypothetical protein POPTR_004G232450v4 [Populus trichocarpa]|uniref:Uncharacterized protein n=1 Tax=Populus trichocarpa TaxID=3694 RepID=A0ACC0T690_POPTR|nr:hypothetical protein POPTR_004G232450v4 [Populus trichocarpa]
MDHAENLTSVRIRKTVQKSIPVDYMDLKCTQASKRQQQNPNSTPWIRACSANQKLGAFIFRIC